MRNEQEAEDIATFERIADLKFTNFADRLYNNETVKTNELVEKYSNEGIASAGKYVNKVSDLVLTKFRTIEAMFEEIYIRPFESTPEKVTKTLETWLRSKASAVVDQQVAASQGQTRFLSFKFQPVPQQRLTSRLVQLRDEGQSMHQRLNHSITALILTAEQHGKSRERERLLEDSTTPDVVPILEAKEGIQAMGTQQGSPEGLAIFISHSSEDQPIAAALTELLKNALGLAPEAIRCTSVDGHRLSVGAKTDERLKHELLNSRSFIALLTEHSLNSTWVLFELGARWGADRHLAPVFAAGLTADQLRGPLPGISGLSCDSDNQIHQLVNDIAEVLGVEARKPHFYSNYVSALMRASQKP